MEDVQDLVLDVKDVVVVVHPDVIQDVLVVKVVGQHVQEHAEELVKQGVLHQDVRILVWLRVMKHVIQHVLHNVLEWFKEKHFGDKRIRAGNSLPGIVYANHLELEYPL